MNMHKNARLTPRGRERIVRQVEVRRPIVVRSRRESHHSDGITDQKSLQPTSATKSARSGLMRCTKSFLFDHLVGARPTVIAFRDRQTSTATRRGVPCAENPRTP